MNRNLHILGRMARRKIGAHYRMIGDSRFTNDEYINVQREMALAEPYTDLWS